MGDLGPEDFTSPEGYKVAKSYYKKTKLKIINLKNKIKRRDKQVETVQELISKLKSMGFITDDASNFLSVSSTINVTTFYYEQFI